MTESIIQLQKQLVKANERIKELEQAMKEAQEQPALSMIVQRHGAIRIENPDGSYFDVSKHVGANLYTRPVPAAPAVAVPSASDKAFAFYCANRAVLNGAPGELREPAVPAEPDGYAVIPRTLTPAAWKNLCNADVWPVTPASFQRMLNVLADEARALLQSAPNPAVAVPAVPEEWRNKLLAEFPLFDDNGLCEEKHHCEWSMQQDRKRLRALLQSTGEKK